MLFSDPFYQVIYPSLSTMVARRQWESVFSGLRKLQRTALAVVIPVAIVISGLMIPLIPLVFGKEFGPAVIPGIISTLGGSAKRGVLLASSAAAQSARSGPSSVVWGGLSALQLMLTLALVRPLGAIGVAISVTAAAWVYFAFEMRLVRSWRVRLVDAKADRTVVPRLERRLTRDLSGYQRESAYVAVFGVGLRAPVRHS